MKKEHLLYILITANCPLSCDFCMTKHLHRDEDLEFNSNAIKSLFNLSKDSKKVCISGEGDPLAAWQSIESIIKHGPDSQHYELITSSYWNTTRTKTLLENLSDACNAKKSTLAYRISIDEYHQTEIKRDVLDILISIFSSTELPHLNLQIRSITGQEEYLFDRISKLFSKYSISYEARQLNEIEHEIISSNLNVKIQFKPTVKPSDFDYEDDWNMDKYIKYLENKRGTDFHIGMMKYSNSSPRYDITINPNGDVVLYGAEPFVLGNVEKEILDTSLITSRIKKNKELSYLTQNKFSHLLDEWRKNSESAELIDKVNNPFWVVRNLHKQGLLNL